MDFARIDPARDGRRLLIYFGALALVYAVGWIVNGVAGFGAAALIIMFAPMVGALAARFGGPGVIWWGRPSWWILAGLLPAVFSLAVLWGSASLAGWIDLDQDLLGKALVLAPVNIALACVSAFGEEVGWRGFLWPLLRGRMRFFAASAVIALIWLAYHIPMVLSGDYGSVGGLPAFTVAIVGFVLFVGVITDRSRSIWPSVVAHGAWNALVANGFSAPSGESAFTGDTGVGEFGWICAIGMLALGLGFAVWHVRSRHGGVLPRTTGPSHESTPVE